MIALGPIQVYAAHRVGAVDLAGVEAHLSAFRRWLRFLVELPGDDCRRLAWSAPWVPYAEALCDGPLVRFRERGLRDAAVAVERADALVALGKPARDRDHAIAIATAAGLPIVDLTPLGELPPVTSSSNWWEGRDTRNVMAQLGALVREVDRRAHAARSVQP